MMTTAVDKNVSGGCVCGQVKYRVKGPMRQVIICHCRQCQRYTGSQVNASQAFLKDFEFIEDAGLKWHDSSEFAKRGFCKECGSSLFYKLKDGDRISIMAGSLDETEGLRAVEHIFVSEKGDYYELDQSLGQKPGAGFDQKWALD